MSKDQAGAAYGVIEHDGVELRRCDAAAAVGPDFHRLPVVLRIIAENVVRTSVGADRERAVDALRAWLEGCSSQEEVDLLPGRVLMHDTTSTPALVDIAAMRSTVAEAGGDPGLLSPVLPVDISVDHSLAVEEYARADAPTKNIEHELRRNRERYRFLKWAAESLPGITVHPPGTGIMHTINLEQLATVVTTEARDGALWAVPDMMIGTDSHTPMINGLGVLGWGVGGLEAQSVMFGLPTTLRIPDVVGVRLSGVLPPGVLATDLALRITHELRTLGVTGTFVEFHGPGVSTLTVGQRAVIANMAPEYGATTGYFPIDDNTLTFLRATGRDAADVRLVEVYARSAGLWFDPTAQPDYTRTLEIDLSALRPHVAGPRRPQDLLTLDGVPAALARGTRPRPAGGSSMPEFPVAIASITSCTNTSDPALLVAAGLLARRARELGLVVPGWVKTSLAPGSPAAASYLRRAGLLEDLAFVGFDIVGFGCATCIGNSGPLTPTMRAAVSLGQVDPVAVLSGNRNFPGRVHPDLDLGLLMSPPLVIAYALAGDATRDLTTESVQLTAAGTAVYLQDLWPDAQEVAAVLARAADPEDFRRDFRVASRNTLWEEIVAPTGVLYPWESSSTILRRPPFATSAEDPLLGDYTAHPLLVLGDDVTTDHISPAGAIPADSGVADFLVDRGEVREDLNVFASRRGNWEVMVRGAFHNRSLRNHLAPYAPPAHTAHAVDGRIMPVLDAARDYAAAGESVVIVAGARYGTGSSRDWAAKAQRLLGIRAVLATGFERIHRSNLIGMGILPLVIDGQTYASFLKMVPGDRIHVSADAGRIDRQAEVDLQLVPLAGPAIGFVARAAVETERERRLLLAGGMIPSILGGILPS